MGNATCREVRIACIYGNIDNVDTTGASIDTARQDNLSYSGVKASEEMAKHDEKSMRKYRSMIIDAATELGMDPSVIAGIISRETRAGSVLPKSGFGVDGHGYGLMQIKSVKCKFPEWTQDMALKGGISAYNAGIDNVRTFGGVDDETNGRDYANDVVARSKYYKRNGY